MSKKLYFLSVKETIRQIPCSFKQKAKLIETQREITKPHHMGDDDMDKDDGLAWCD